jgi:acyl-CoA thioesterase-1
LVVARAVPGENTADIDVRTKAELSEVAPDVLVLFTGMNDAVNDKKFLTPTSTRAHLESILGAGKAARTRIVLVTVHQPDVSRLMQRHKPEAYGNRSPEQRISELNEVVISLGRKHHLLVADFSRTLASRGGATDEWSTDGVHLTAQGYHLLALVVLEQVRKIPNVRRILCLGDSITFGVGVRAVGAPENSEIYPRQLKELIDGSDSRSAK